MPEEWVSLLPRSSRLENEVTNGRVVWIQEFSFNAMTRTLEFVWTHNPETLTRDGRISFGGQTEFAMTYSSEFDKDCLANLIGLDEYPDSEFSRFVIHTTDWEMVFASAESPRLAIPSIGASVLNLGDGCTSHRAPNYADEPERAAGG